MCRSGTAAFTGASSCGTGTSPLTTCAIGAAPVGI
jgi:hypothetical protein